MDAHRDDLKDLITDLNAEGLLKEDGLQRFDLLDQYSHGYGQRDAPDDKSIFEYRKDEYDYFAEHRRLPYWGHEDYKGNGSNLDTEMDQGSSVGS